MIKKIALTSIGLLIVASPLVASADLLSDIQAQIQAVQAQIAQLIKSQPATSALAYPSDDYPSTSTPTTSCPKLSITMQRGSRDATTKGQVSELQIFLASFYNVDEESIVSGYFGGVTERYVMQFQKENDLPVFGIVGSLTRAKIAAICGGGGASAVQALTAMPKQGGAPLSVTFSTMVSGFHVPGTYTIDYGDGASEKATYCYAPADFCQKPGQNTHTYTKSGVYNARLLESGACAAPSGTACATTQHVAGTATVTVTGSTSPSTLPGVTLEVASVTSNTFLATVNLGQWTSYIYSLDFGEGDGSSQTDRSRTVIVCNSEFSCAAPAGFTHTYINPGLYVVNLFAMKSGTSASTRTLVATAGVRVSDATSSISIKLTAPNSEAYFPRNLPMYVKWSSVNIPFSSSVLIRLRDTNTSQEYNLAISPTNDGNETVSLGDIPIGAYRVEVKTETGGISYMDESDVYIKITEAGGPGTPITVTAPNGGEKWEIGQLNTITWAPYGYNPNVNPSGDVHVYLQKCQNDGSPSLACTQIGRIMDTGKASLHTYFNINSYDTWAEPGQYYVRVVNSTTGQEDRSDAPFTLVAKSADLKVNNSDGPVNLSYGQKIAVTLTTGPDVSTCTIYGIRSTEGGNGPVQIGPPINQSPTQISAIFSDVPVNSIYTRCVKKDGSDLGDSVAVNPTSTAATLKITTPNGGETFDPTKALNTHFTYSGLKSYSIALYKNDQWKFWLAKDNQLAGNGFQDHSWQTPASVFPGLGTGDEAGAIWKIYITGQKADGTGYVDDKSDRPFRFVTATSTPPLPPSPTAGPKKNVMSCSSPSRSGVGTGGLACYGLWDYGSEFGDDEDMCPENGYGTGTTGCRIETTACQSGSAKATRLISVSSASSGDLSTLAKNFSTSIGAVQSQLINVWEYTCVAKEPAPTNVPGPKKNAMSCSSPSQKEVAVGQLACYGIWDSGSEFGGDENMCPNKGYTTATTGCRIQTAACQTGWAKATRLISVSSASSGDLAILANNLTTSVGAVQSQLIDAWEYTCATAN